MVDVLLVSVGMVVCGGYEVSLHLAWEVWGVVWVAVLLMLLVLLGYTDGGVVVGVY